MSGNPSTESKHAEDIARFTFFIEAPDAPPGPLATSLVQRGSAYESRGHEGDLELAIADYSCAAEIPGAHPYQVAAALTRRASACRQRMNEGDEELIRADLLRASQIGPPPVEEAPEVRARRVLHEAVAELFEHAKECMARRGPGDLDQAIENYSQVAGMPKVWIDERVRAVLQRAEALMIRRMPGDVDRAIADCSKVVKLPRGALEWNSIPGYARSIARRQRAEALRLRGGPGDLDAAIEDICWLVECNRSEWRGLYRYLLVRAELYWLRGESGDLQLAMADCTRIIEDPEMRDVAKAKAREAIKRLEE